MARKSAMRTADTQPEGTIGFVPGAIAHTVFTDLKEECGLDEAQIFLVADALLTEAALTLQAKRAETLAQARGESSPHYVVKNRAAALSRNPKRR